MPSAYSSSEWARLIVGAYVDGNEAGPGPQIFEDLKSLPPDELVGVVHSTAILALGSMTGYARLCGVDPATFIRGILEDFARRLELSDGLH